MRLAIVFLLCLLSLSARAQVELSGRLVGERLRGSGLTRPFSGVLCFSSLPGAGSEARGFRTWETEPTGWFRLTGSPGVYTLVFSDPAGYVRPLVVNNLFFQNGERVDDFRWAPVFDHAVFVESSWDSKPARGYYQLWVARGTSLTQAGFKLATDGVDGFGPGKQDFLVSVHRVGESPPESWGQVGPTGLVPDVDCGGAKNYEWSAGWNSGEVPLEPGRVYAVHLRPKNPEGRCQAFWQEESGSTPACYRIGSEGGAWQKRNLWMAIASDGDGLLLPYNKKVHKQFGEFAGFASKWVQTYVAQGRSLASVILYAAVGGTQPPLSRQRLAVRVREGGANGPLIGTEKIAIGNGNYTGDASWGTFGVAFAPGEVPLIPGTTYALEWESIENHETLHGFVNIKGQASDERPGFNPYTKIAPDDYPAGAAYKLGRDKTDSDLDLQVIEYEWENPPGAEITLQENLLPNGDMEEGLSDPDHNRVPCAAGWNWYSLDPAKRPRCETHQWILEEPARTNRVVRLMGGSATGEPLDGGCFRQVDGLSRRQTYQLTGRFRASWPLDGQHQCLIGYDPTGQVLDAKAPSIQWRHGPALHGHWIGYQSDPIRPAQQSISIWLRARTTLTNDYPFRVDFDDFSLRQVNTGLPRPRRPSGPSE